MISFQAHGDRHWYQSLTVTAAAGSLNPLGTAPLRDEPGKASSACAVLKAPLTAPQQGRPLQPNPPGRQRGLQRAPHPPGPPSVMSLCTPNRSLGSMGPGSSPACPHAAPRAVSCLCIQPSHKQLSHREAPISPILGGSRQRLCPGGRAPQPSAPRGAGAGGCSPLAACSGRRHVHPLLTAGARAGWDLLAQGSWSSPSAQLFQGTSMAVTLSERVYNPATALGSLDRAGGRLGSRGCRSAGTRCRQRPAARVSRTPRYPRGCPDASPWRGGTGTWSWRRSAGAVPMSEVWEADGQMSPSPTATGCSTGVLINLRRG